MTATLAAVMGGYLDLRWRLNPVEATFHGVSGFDGVFAAYDPESVRAQLAALVAYENAIEEADTESLAEEIDRTAVLHALRHDILLLAKERQLVPDPAYHLLHAVTGIFILLARQPADPLPRAPALTQRLAPRPASLPPPAPAPPAPAHPPGPSGPADPASVRAAHARWVWAGDTRKPGWAPWARAGLRRRPRYTPAGSGDS